jgi:hypothetical protein
MDKVSKLLHKHNVIVNNIKTQLDTIIDIQDSISNLIKNMDDIEPNKSIASNNSDDSSSLYSSSSSTSIFSTITDSLDAEISKNILEVIDPNYNVNIQNKQNNNGPSIDPWIPPSKPGLQNSSPLIDFK